jgi:hypothetical protein
MEVLPFTRVQQAIARRSREATEMEMKAIEMPELAPGAMEGRFFVDGLSQICNTNWQRRGLH